MNHGWDDRNRQDQAGRSEQERYGARPIEPDAEVLRRDRIREIERIRAMNQSPWAIGVSHWNQRDLYTKNSSIEDAGYGQGPAMHPAEGSYAYHREVHAADIGPRGPREGKATLQEREAWPQLNYTTAHDDPYFAHLDHTVRHDSYWERLKQGVSELIHPHANAAGKAPKNAARPDTRVLEDVADALTFRGDLDATDIEVNVHEGEVTLSGTVTDRRSKHVAEEVCEGVLGVKDVHNKLTIRKDDPTDANVAFVLPLSVLGGC